MAKTDFKTIDDYMATFPESVQKVLQQYRATIRKALPEAEEAISYQIPCFKLNGPVIYFSAHKNHVTVSSPPPAIATFSHKLSGYKTSVSGFHVPYGEQIPKDLIAEIAKWRAAENARNAKK